MKKMLLLALAMGCSALVYATPQKMDQYAENLAATLQRDVVAAKFGDGKESFERNGEILYLDRHFFTLDISLDADPQIKKRNKAQIGTDFRVNVYQGAAGTIYIKRYPAGMSASELFDMRPVKKCDAISYIPTELVVSGRCKYDDAYDRTYSVSKFITQGANVYEFTYVTSQKFMQESANYYPIVQVELKIMDMLRKTSNKTITDFFHSDFFIHGEDYPRTVER